MSVKLVWVAPEAEALIARIARVSSPQNQDNPDYEKLLNYCIRNNHVSIFEMVNMCIEIKCSRSISRQIIRHRSFSFQEFCISGDSEVTCVSASGSTKKIPIKKLYEYQNDPRMSVIWERGIRTYNLEAKTLDRAIVKEVFYTGKKITYSVVLEDGKTIKATKDHKFLSRSGFKPLEDLSVGDLVAVNGQDVYQSYEWMKEVKEKCLVNKTGVQGIADAAGCSYHTIRKWLRVHKLQFTKLETASMCTVWNKGLPTEQQPRFGKLVDEETRERMRESSRKGSDSNLYTNGNSTNASDRTKVFQWQHKYKNFLLKKFNNKCAMCDSSEDLEIDHVNPVWSHPEQAKDIENLQLLCNTHHRIKSVKETVDSKQTVRWKKIVSITLHGEEDTYDLEVEHDSHNYVADGILVHNSQRYQSVIDEPIFVEARMQDTKNRQSSTVCLDANLGDMFEDMQDELWSHAYQSYETALKAGIAKECARALLPEGMSPSTFYMSGNVRSWISFLEVRLFGPGVQKECRDVAREVFKIFKENFPTICAAKGWV